MRNRKPRKASNKYQVCCVMIAYHSIYSGLRSYNHHAKRWALKCGAHRRSERPKKIMNNIHSTMYIRSTPYSVHSLPYARVPTSSVLSLLRNVRLACLSPRFCFYCAQRLQVHCSNLAAERGGEMKQWIRTDRQTERERCTLKGILVWYVRHCWFIRTLQKADLYTTYLCMYI
jgi:hypothetical protein